MSALSVRPVLSSIAHLYFQLRRLTRRPVPKGHQLSSYLCFIGTFTVLLISHARAHCRLPHGPTCGDMGGMPGWISHCNATATHIAPVRTQHAPVTGTSTYARKSWSGHPRCDLAPLTTSFRTVGQWERQNLAMAATTSPEVVEWAPRCDLAPQSTSFGTVALRECQHLAMAGSRHHHSPRNATAHRAARANHSAVSWHKSTYRPVVCRKCVKGYSYAVRQGSRGMDTKVALVVRCLAPLPLS